MDKNWRDVYYTSHDGLRLHARHYPAPGSARRPLICLAGLTRNARDFHDLASFCSLPTGHRRAVYCLDYRGRGLSEHAADWESYTIANELADVLSFMTLFGLHDCAVLGTSRGGLIAMVMAAARPTAIGCCILNDIGPKIEREGLARIAGYVGKIPLPANWEQATALVRDLSKSQFTAVDDKTWAEVARQWYFDDNGLPSASYDKNLSRTISDINSNTVLPDLWPQFQALGRVPVMCLRGQNSDLLSAATVRRMGEVHPQFSDIEVRGQGHAPLLKDRQTITAITDFLAATDDQHGSAVQSSDSA